MLVVIAAALLVVMWILVAYTDRKIRIDNTLDTSKMSSVVQTNAHHIENKDFIPSEAPIRTPLITSAPQIATAPQNRKWHWPSSLISFAAGAALASAFFITIAVTYSGPQQSRLRMDRQIEQPSKQTSALPTAQQTRLATENETRLAIAAWQKTYGIVHGTTFAPLMLRNPDGSICGLVVTKNLPRNDYGAATFVTNETGILLSIDRDDRGFRNYFGREYCRDRIMQPQGRDFINVLGNQPF